MGSKPNTDQQFGSTQGGDFIHFQEVLRVLNETYTDSCSICVGILEGINVVEVAGEIDIATVSLLARALADATHSGKKHVILDAQKLTYIDSAGLQTLLSTRLSLAATNHRVVIVGCHGIFYKLMKITNLSASFSMYPTVEEAIAALNE